MEKSIDNSINNKKKNILLDSCYIFYLIYNEHQQKELRELNKNNKLFTTSFNIHEMLYHHKIKKHLLTKFLKENNVLTNNINIEPGNKKNEEEYVKSIEPNLLKIIPDVSDAVIVASALKFNMDCIISRDRKHIFNPKVYDFLKTKNIEILHK